MEPGEVNLVDNRTGQQMEGDMDNPLAGSVFKTSCVKVKKTAIQNLVELGKSEGEEGATDVTKKALETTTTDENGFGEFLSLAKANPNHDGLGSVLQEGAVLRDINYRLQRTKDILNSFVIYNPHKSGSNVVFEFQLTQGSLTLDRGVPRPVFDPATDIAESLFKWFHSMFRWIFQPSDSQQADITLKDLACFQPKLGGIPLLSEEAAAKPDVTFPVHGGIGGRQVGVHLKWGGSNCVFGVEAVFCFPSVAQNMLNDPTFPNRLERTLQQHSRWMGRREQLLPDDMVVQLCFIQIKSTPIRHILKLLGMDMATLEDNLLRPLLASMAARAEDPQMMYGLPRHR